MALDSQTPRQPRLHGATQAGQAIVLVALLMVILLGILGLAIDGGGMFLLYRDAQNAADAASLTAAYARCTNVPDWQQRAYETLALNGFTEKTTDTAGNPLADDHPDYINLTVEPISGTNEILVKIEANKPSYFIQMLYNGPLGVDIEAVSICNPGTPGSASSASDIDTFASFAPKGTCTAGEALLLAGTGFTVVGSIWMDNIRGRDGLQTGGDHSVPLNMRDNNIDIIGDIYVASDSTSQYGTGQNDKKQTLVVEDIAGTQAGNGIPDMDGIGGDGSITYGDQPGGRTTPPTFPYTFADFQPGGSWATAHGSDYHDLTSWCTSTPDNKFFNQDYNDNSFPYYDKNTNVWTSGIYYIPCEVTLAEQDMTGNVTFISTHEIVMNTNRFDFTAFDEFVLISNEGTRGSNCSNLSDIAIRFNGNHSKLKGRVIAFNGTVTLAGNGFYYDSCTMAWGIYANGNDGSVYRCTGDGATGPIPSSINLER